MRVFVAEKPSLGRAIAAVLPGPQERHKTHIISGEGNVVVWCVGHLMTQCMPEDYNPAFERWALEHLPIMPDEWRLKLGPKTRELYSTIKRYVKQASVIIHAGDPDREGQWVVDAVLEQIGIGKTPVKRLLISDLNPPAVRKALGNMSDNAEYRGLRDAAVGRTRADWLYGLNLTRLYTLKGRSAGLSGVLSVGRVQTPVLGLVVRRDREIANFEANAFYTVQASVTAAGSAFTAQWQPGERAGAYLDPEGRVMDRAYADSVANALIGQSGQVTAFRRNPDSVPPPLPFSLPELQKMAAKLKGLSPRRTLDVAQSLYEKHQLLTYPRSDCPYLPRGHHGQASEVRESIAQTLGRNHPVAPLTDAVNLTHYGRCWNDSKVTAHHAIIPTTRSGALSQLSPDEQFIYGLVAHRYLLQFLPSRQLEKTVVEMVVPTAGGDEKLQAKQALETAAGWYAWRHFVPVKGDGEQTSDEAVEEGRGPLIVLKPGQSIQVMDAQRQDKMTTPPKPFTEATLLDAMTGVARFVEDPLIRKVLRDTDGLGTPATQATILETLYKRGYLGKQRKTVMSTDLGKALIDALPEFVTLPDMTALWELNLNQIVEGDETLSHFMASIEGHVEKLIGEGAGGLKVPHALKGKNTAPRKTPPRRNASKSGKSTAITHPCTGEGCEGQLRRIKGKHGFFWGCSNYSEGCREIRKDSRGKPVKQ